MAETAARLDTTELPDGTVFDISVTVVACRLGVIAGRSSSRASALAAICPSIGCFGRFQRLVCYCLSAMSALGVNRTRLTMSAAGGF